MEHFITLCRESAAAADDPEHATELIAMANAIALGMQARAVPPIKPRMHGTATRRPQVTTAIMSLWRALRRDLFDRYRPELYYMRGPGPKWRAKHQNPCQVSAP
jgi:hypothetical protein